MDFLEKALSFIFPPVCGICGKPDESYLCKQCYQKWQKEKNTFPIIENYQKNKTSFIKEHCYLFPYKGILREKILQYKFDNKAYLARMFFEFFVKNEKVCGFLKNYDIIIPVPMTKKKVAQRGYNQSEIIARKIAKKRQIPIEKNVLQKKRNNQTQSMLKKAQRFENVKNVYKIENKQKIKEKKIVLFDDIYTTGATVNECAKILLQEGAETVGVLTIAKDFQKTRE